MLKSLQMFYQKSKKWFIRHHTQKGAYSDHSMSMANYVTLCVLYTVSQWAEQFLWFLIKHFSWFHGIHLGTIFPDFPLMEVKNFRIIILTYLLNTVCGIWQESPFWPVGKQRERRGEKVWPLDKQNSLIFPDLRDFFQISWLFPDWKNGKSFSRLAGNHVRMLQYV